MQAFWLVVLIYFTSKDTGKVSGIYITTMLPLPRDLKLLLDSMYDEGYTAEYLIKYDPSKGDNSQSDFMIGGEDRNRNIPNGYSGAIIDPDRDGVRNIPPWMNFTKAVFVPNEIDYKIRARHKFYPHSGRIGGTLQKQVARFHDDEEEFNFGSNENQEASSNKMNSNTHGTLDYLLPIPEYEEQATSRPYDKPAIFKFHESRKKEFILPPTTKNCILPTNKISQLNAQQNPLGYLTSPSYDQNNVVPEPEGIIVSPHSLQTNSTSGFSWVELLKKTFKYKKKDNIIDMKKNDTEGSLDSLLSKLINMRTLEDNNQKIHAEKKYLYALKGKTAEDVKQTKRLRQLRPTIVRTKIMHPGHRATYIQHFGPFNLQSNIINK